MLLKLPFYAKWAFMCIGIYFFISMLYIAQSIIVPLIFGTIIAVLLHPLVKLLVKWKFNRILAIIIALLLSVAILAAFGIFMYLQLSMFSNSWPVFVEKITNLFNQTIQWIPGYFDISAVKMNAWIIETKTELLDTSSLVIGKTILSVGSSLVAVFLIPVYVFLLLFYKPILVDFIHQLFDSEKQGQVNVIIRQTRTVIQQYLVGLLIESVIVATLNSVGLLVLGIDYAILIGVLGAILNLIPYVGGLVAVSLPMMIALVTKDSPWSALYVMIIYITIQLFDNNFIVPKIVASKVRINALVSIVVVLAGGALWGVSGMFLSIPLIAIIKVVCDHIDSLKPIGFLLGDTMPEIINFNIKPRKKFKM